MSMMMPPEAPPGLPIPPGGGEAGMGGPAPPRDLMNQMPLPGEGGLDGLLSALGAGGGMPPELGGGAPEEPPLGEEGDLDPIEHIQQAMKHLMMAIAKDEDEERGVGITKGMGALQAILGGEQKKTSQLAALS
jgi:hypothetical protein